MVVHLVNVSRRMAIIEMPGGVTLRLSRSKADGSTVGYYSGRAGWKTLDTQELLDALSWVTLTNDQLVERGFTEQDVKSQRKRDYKAEYARRKYIKENSKKTPRIWYVKAVNG